MKLRDRWISLLLVVTLLFSFACDVAFASEAEHAPDEESPSSDSVEMGEAPYEDLAETEAYPAAETEAAEDAYSVTEEGTVDDLVWQTIDVQLERAETQDEWDEPTESLKSVRRFWKALFDREPALPEEEEAPLSPEDPPDPEETLPPFPAPPSEVISIAGVSRSPDSEVPEASPDSEISAASPDSKAPTVSRHPVIFFSVTLIITSPGESILYDTSSIKGIST